MVRFRKILFYIVTILFINCPHTHGQNISTPLSDSVFCYLTADKNVREKGGYNLIIHNGSRDSIFIEGFNKYIFHVSAFHFKRKENRVFFWNLLTISNQKPKDIVMILPDATTTPPQKKQMDEKNKTIIIPPDSIFVSDVYMLHSPFVTYPKGYYKLCLYYEKNSNCIAEIIVKNE